jgi:hypothetical protein
MRCHEPMSLPNGTVMSRDRFVNLASEFLESLAGCNNLLAQSVDRDENGNLILDNLNPIAAARMIRDTYGNKIFNMNGHGVNYGPFLNSLKEDNPFFKTIADVMDERLKLLEDQAKLADPVELKKLNLNYLVDGPVYSMTEL